MSFAQVTSCMLGTAILMVLGQLIVDATMPEVPHRRGAIRRSPRERSMRR